MSPLNRWGLLGLRNAVRASCILTKLRTQASYHWSLYPPSMWDASDQRMFSSHAPADVPDAIALVRGVPDSFADALTLHEKPEAIDVAKAREQHAAYVEQLKSEIPLPPACIIALILRC